MQLFPGTDEDVLRQLLGAAAVRDHAGAQGEDPIHMLPIQALERTPIPGRRARDVRIDITELIRR
jgi:hypothetical protein